MGWPVQVRTERASSLAWTTLPHVQRLLLQCPEANTPPNGCRARADRSVSDGTAWGQMILLVQTLNGTDPDQKCA